MANRFNTLFTADMTDKQICFRYWETEKELQLKPGSQDYKDLREAFLKATSEARDREFDRLERIEKENSNNGKTCICLT